MITKQLHKGFELGLFLIALLRPYIFKFGEVCYLLGFGLFQRINKKGYFHTNGFLSYNSYASKVAFLDRFNFQQETRKHNIKVMQGVGRL